MPTPKELLGPSKLTAIAQNESVNLRWDHVEGADGYRVFVYDAKDQQFNPIKYTSAPEKTIYALQNNHTYFFKVKAFKQIDGQEVYSDFSEAISGTPTVMGLAVSKSFLLLNSAQTFNITCTYDGMPTDFVEYTSSDEKIATVNRLGVITACSPGEALITAFSPAYKQSAAIKVVVDRTAPEPALPIKKSRFIYQDGLYVNPGSSVSLLASIVFTGDMMCISNQQKKALCNGIYNFYDSFKLVRPIISEADFAIGTLETMLSESHSYALEELKVDGKPNCNAPANFLDGVRYAGFDAIVTATNHSCDTELSGIEETLSHINRYNLLNLGINERYFIVNLNGIRVAFFAYNMVSNKREGFLNELEKEFILCVYSKQTFENDYRSAKARGAEFFIVMMHWGIMNSTMVRRSQKLAAKELADVGADYIIGSHPHVLQKAAIIQSVNGKKVPIIYSLGNLISSMREMLGNTDTVLLKLTLEKNSEGVKIKNSQYLPCVILPKYREINYMTTPILPEFCGYLGINTSKILQRIDRIKEIAGDQLSLIGFDDPIFQKLAVLAPEALLFKATGLLKEDTLLLEWEQIDGADGYRIYKQNENGDFTGFINSATNRSQIKLSENKALAYKIKAYKEINGSKDFFRTSMIVRPNLDDSAKQPEAFLFKANNFFLGNLVVLTWDQVKGADGYRIYQKNPDNIFTGLLNSNNNYRRITGLETNCQHEFKIKAYKLKNNQKQFFATSQTVNIFLPYCRPIPALCAETGNENEIRLNWISDKSAEGYRVYRENSDGVFIGVTDVLGDEFSEMVNEKPEEVRYKVKPYATLRAQRLYYNSSNILVKLTAEPRETPLISFVVPVYNDEKYLERLFNSILSNTKINCEVILVNDGSSDNSQKVIDKYCEKFPLVFRSIVQENQGVSKARNAGVAAASGKYIGFLDSDDSIRPETCELYEIAIQTKADIIIANYYKREKSQKIVIQGQLPFEEYKRLDINLYLSLLYGKGSAGQAAVWNKLYRAELVKDRPMPSIKTEDVAWSPYIASYANSFCYIAAPLYEYLRREGSTSDIINMRNEAEIFERRMRSINFFMEFGNPLKSDYLYSIAERRLEWHIRNSNDNKLYVQELQKLKKRLLFADTKI